MTLTIGGFGIWTFIDLFLINGMLKKKNSEIKSEIINKIQLLNQEPKEHIVKNTPIRNTETNINKNTKPDIKKTTNNESGTTTTHSQQIPNLQKENKETSHIESRIYELIEKNPSLTEEEIKEIILKEKKERKDTIQCDK